MSRDKPAMTARKMATGISLGKVAAIFTNINWKIRSVGRAPAAASAKYLTNRLLAMISNNKPRIQPSFSRISR